MDTELLKALDDTSLKDLHVYLMRYCNDFNTEKEAMGKYPEITQELVVAAIGYSDECPVCINRFIRLGGNHDKDCALAELFADRGLGI